MKQILFDACACAWRYIYRQSAKAKWNSINSINIIQNIPMGDVS